MCVLILRTATCYTQIIYQIKENLMKNDKQSKYFMYKEYYESCRKKLDKLTLASDKISLLRGITFAIAGLLLLIGYQQKKPVLFVPAVGLGFAFLVLIRYHSKQEKEQAYLKDSQSVLKEYMARFGDGWKSFPVDGARYLSDDFLEAKDLDFRQRFSSGFCFADFP